MPIRVTDRILGTPRGSRAEALVARSGFVQARMLRLRHHFQVVPNVVRGIAVFVVNDLLRRQESTEVFFCHQTMLGDVATSVRFGMFRSPDVDITRSPLNVASFGWTADADLRYPVARRGTVARGAPLCFVFGSTHFAPMDAVKGDFDALPSPALALNRAVDLIPHDGGGTRERRAAHRTGFPGACGQSRRSLGFALACPGTIARLAGAARLYVKRRAANFARLRNWDRLGGHFAGLRTGRMGCRGAGLFAQSRPHFVGVIVP